LAGGEDIRSEPASASARILTPRRLLDGARRRVLRPWSLRTALALLVFSVMLPTLVFFAIQYRAAITEKQSEIEAQGRNLASNLANNIGYELAIKEAQLAALALSNRLEAGDVEGFYEQCKAVSRNVNGGIVLYRSDGSEVFNTRRPLDQTERKSQHADLIAQAAREGRSRVTNVFRSRTDNEFVVSLVYPVPGTDYVLGGAIPSRLLSAVLQRAIPHGWLASLVDRDGIALARSRNADQFVGQPASAEFKANIFAAPMGWMESRPLDSEEALTAWRRLDNGWTVIASVDRRVVEAPLVAWQQDLLRGLILFSLLAILLAVIVANWIIGSIRKLEDAAAAMSKTQPVPATSTAIAEINRVGEVLHHASVERRRSEIANAHLAAIVSSSGDAIKSMALDGTVLTWNAGAEQLYGYSAEEMIGQPITKVMPEDCKSDFERKVMAAREGKTLRFETKRRHKNGTIIDVSLNAAPIYDSEGHVIAISTIAHDITDRKRNEAHTRFIMRELSHRSKNLLSIVLSFARQTWNKSRDFSDFEQRFAGRLHGLARSHDLLVHQNWRGAYIEDLVRSHLLPFIDEDDGRIDIDGPNLFLRPEAVQNLGYAFHELATNASKYGALSRPQGKIIVRWRLANVDGAAEKRVYITWHESGGPAVEAPSSSGLGSMLIGTFTEKALDATVTTHYESAGLVWEFEAPADRMMQRDDGDLSELASIAAAMRSGVAQREAER